MKICIAGKNNIAVDVCACLLQKYGKESLYIIPNRADTGINSFQKSLKQYAGLHDLPVVSLEEIYPIPDLIFLSLEFDKIVRPEKFRSSQLYNIHFSLLPGYKGMFTSALPILNNERFTGVTFHRIDSGIDTGEIIAQKKIPIREQDTAETLYQKYIRYGTALVLDQLGPVIKGDVESKPQSPKNSFYYSRQTIDYTRLQIDLKATAWQIALQIRAFTFRPYQLPTVSEHKIFGCRISNRRSSQSPGTPLEETQEKIVLATIDYDIELFKDRYKEILSASQNNDVHQLRQISQLSSYIEEKNSNGWTPLIVATYHNAKDAFYFLVKRGADLHAVNNNGTTLLMYAKDAALRTGDKELLDYIITHDCNLRQADYQGKNIFDYLKEESAELYNYLKTRHD